MAESFGWERVLEGDKVIALLKNKCSITLEPGGQFELSGAPLQNIHETCNEVHTHLDQVRRGQGILEHGSGSQRRHSLLLVGVLV